MTSTATSSTSTTREVGTSRARVPLEHPGSAWARVLDAWSRRRYGKALEPARAMLHNRRVLTTVARFELGVEKWRALDPGLKHLAELAVAGQIGCSWCMDFGWFRSHGDGVDLVKLQHLADWRAGDVYSPLERKVLEYAEAMTATPPEVTDEMVARLRDDLGDAALIELTEIISVENLRSRTNAALGLTSQGFKDLCELRR